MSLINPTSLTLSVNIQDGIGWFEFPRLILQNLRESSLKCHHVFLRSTKKVFIAVKTNVSSFEGSQGLAENILASFYIDKHIFSHHNYGQIGVPINKFLNKIEIFMTNENGDIEKSVNGKITLEIRGLLPTSL